MNTLDSALLKYLAKDHTKELLRSTSYLSKCKRNVFSFIYDNGCKILYLFSNTVINSYSFGNKYRINMSGTGRSCGKNLDPASLSDVTVAFW